MLLSLRDFETGIWFIVPGQRPELLQALSSLQSYAEASVVRGHDSWF